MQSCLSKSTAHGLANIGNEKRVPGKLIWVLFTILTLACFIYHTYLLHNQLLEEHVLVSTHPDSVPFLQPDIVFCPERFLSRDFINYPPENEYEFMFNVSKTIQKIDKTYSKIDKKSPSFIWDSLNSHQLHKAFSQRKHELFLSILCNQIPISFELLQEEMNFEHFVCYRMNSSSCRLKSPMDSLIIKFYTHIYGINITYSALNVLIDKKPIDSYLFTEKEPIHEMEDGMHIYLVQPQEGISDVTTKITASVNSHTTLKIKSLEYNKVSTKNNICKNKKTFNQIYNLLESDITLNPINITSDSLCMETSFQKWIYSMFSCVSKRFPISRKLTTNLKFCGDISNSSQGSNFLILWNKPLIMSKIIRDCKLMKPCRSIRHMAVINYNKWPRTSILRGLFQEDILNRVEMLKSMKKYSPGLEEALNAFNRDPTKIDSWKRNFIKISISPAEFMSSKIEESSAYSFKNFFSDTGGIMGFYMGASLMTVCELFRLLQCTIKSLIKSNKNESKTEELSLNDS